MRQHNGMRPHDIAVLLKIAGKKDTFSKKDLADELFISPSEISESLSRSAIAGLIDPSKTKVFTKALLDFLINGMKYVFPVVPGAPARGIFTGHSSPVMSQYFDSEESYVWPDASGQSRGTSIQPLYRNAVKAVKADDTLYDMLSLCDVIRTGKVREVEQARVLLSNLINQNVES